MPDSTIQWAWFTFFSLGAIGGLAYLAQLVGDVVTAIRLAKARRG